MKSIWMMFGKYKGMSVVAKATLWFFVCTVIQKCISIITTPIFTRLMSVEQYGQVSIFNSWMQIVTLICTLRLDYGVFYKGISKFKDDKDGYTLSMQSLSSIITLIVLFFYMIFRESINALTELSTFLSLMMILEVFATFSVSYWTIRNRYDYNYKKIVIVTIAMSIFNVAAGLVAAILSENKGVARIVSAAIVETIIGLAVYIINIQRGKRLINLAYVKFAVLFNLPLIPHYLSTYILEQSDRIMIQKMVGVSEAGLYSVAYNAGIMIKIVSNSINNALVPWEYRKLEENDFDTLNKKLNSFMILFSFAALSFIALAPEAISVLAGEKYYSAVYCIPPVTASCFFVFVWGVYGNAEFYYDANKFTMYISGAGAIINLILNYVCIKTFGYVAAAHTTLFCYMLFTISHFVFVNHISEKKCGIKAFDARCLTILSIALLAGSVILSLLYNHMLVRYILILVTLILAFVKRKQIADIVKFK